MENFHISKCLTSYFLYISSDGELASAKKFIIYSFCYDLFLKKNKKSFCYDFCLK